MMQNTLSIPKLVEGIQSGQTVMGRAIQQNAWVHSEAVIGQSEEEKRRGNVLADDDDDDRTTTGQAAGQLA